MANEKSAQVKAAKTSSPICTSLVFLAFLLQAIFLSNFPPRILTRWNEETPPSLLLNERPTEYNCYDHRYSTEIVSLDPLVVYIRNFTYPEEIEGLLEAGEPNFSPSQIYHNGGKVPTQARTSSSAGLPLDSPFVECILSRARSFMGSMLLPHPHSEFGVPQLVRYQAGQRFDEHHDWYDSPRPHYDGSGRLFNRVASFFVFLEDNCTKGETYFPHVRPVEAGFLPRWDDAVRTKEEYRRHRNGGVAFRPIAGNAIFWVNLFANGTGDMRTVHSGLPVGTGTKTAMNIWPRKFY